LFKTKQAEQVTIQHEDKNEVEEEVKVEIEDKKLNDEELAIDNDPIDESQNKMRERHSLESATVNKSDKKRYDREFLLQMKAKASEKPEGLPQIPNVTIDISNRPDYQQQSSYGQHTNGSRRSMDNSSYPFGKGSMGKRGGGAGGGRGGGAGGGRGGPGSQIGTKHNIQLQSQQDVKLSTTENAYKPVKMVNTQLDETERVLRGVRTILNKLTPQNFQKLVSDLVQMEINVNEDRLRGTIDIIFEKSIDEPAFSQTYANLCKALNTVC
jgi:translation initiation factor 4G